MSSIRDEDLILYFYRDGLSSERLAEIEGKLATDAELAARYRALCSDLDRAGAAFSDDEPHPGFDDRVWTGFEQRLMSAGEPVTDHSSRSSRSSRSLHSSRSSRRPPHRRGRSWIRAGALVASALGVGLLIGRLSVPTEPTPQFLEADAGTRVLAAALVRHLESTEQTLLVATRNPHDPDLIRELADSLLDSHRLYASAADRAGRPDLAAFLRELEPILLRLANADTLGGPDAIRESIVQDDLPFKIRVVAATTRRDLKTRSPSRL